MVAVASFEKVSGQFPALMAQRLGGQVHAMRGKFKNSRAFLLEFKNLHIFRDSFFPRGFFFDPPTSFSSTKRWKGGKITLPLHFFEDGVWEGGGRGGGGLQRKILISPSSFLSSVRRKRGGGGEEGGCLNPSLRRRLHLQSSSSSLPCFTAPLFSAPNLNTCTPLYPTRRKEGKSFC